jgi:hypothetical protein
MDYTHDRFCRAPHWQMQRSAFAKHLLLRASGF